MFAATDPALLEEILVDNGVGPAMIRRCLKENRLLDAIVERQTRSGKALLFFIYQLEEMRRRIDEGGFESCSLTLMAGRPVRVNLDQYARGLLHVTRMMKRNPGAQVVLASEEDHNQLPAQLLVQGPGMDGADGRPWRSLLAGGRDGTRRLRGARVVTQYNWRPGQQDKFFVSYGFGQVDVSNSPIWFGISRMNYVNGWKLSSRLDTRRGDAIGLDYSGYFLDTEERSSINLFALLYNRLRLYGSWQLSGFSFSLSVDYALR